jgi:hypothetical protein
MSDSMSNPDVTNTSKAYWEKVLRNHNLDMSRGRRRIDEIAEQAYCAEMADRLRDEGRELPTIIELRNRDGFRLDNLDEIDGVVDDE